jgi:hypothetical protein
VLHARLKQLGLERGCLLLELLLCWAVMSSWLLKQRVWQWVV